MSCLRRREITKPTAPVEFQGKRQGRAWETVMGQFAPSHEGYTMRVEIDKWAPDGWRVWATNEKKLGPRFNDGRFESRPRKEKQRPQSPTERNP